MIIIRIWEGLGNQMFQYAYARALKAKGIDVRLDLDKAYDEVFIIKKNRKDDLRSSGLQNFRISILSINVKKYKKYDYLQQNTIYRKILFWLGTHSLWKYKFFEEKYQMYFNKKVKPKENYYIKGWFQDEKYFKSIRSILLKEFVPRKKIKLSKEIKEAVESPESVSIHIRRGDYVKLQCSLNSVYYEKAINYMKTKYKNPIFVIFSDDLEWVKQNLHVNGRLIYVNEDKKLQDFEELFIMSKCKSNIISNSTFSWWGAWLNQNKKKIIIAPKKWFKPQENIIPQEWIIL